MNKLALHWKILIGMTMGVIFGLVMSYVVGGSQFVGDYIKPFGSIFINLFVKVSVISNDFEVISLLLFTSFS